MKIGCLFSCDVWKSRGSMRLLGVFTDPRKLLAAVSKLVVDGAAVSRTDTPVLEMDERMLADGVDYIHIEWLDENCLEGRPVEAP